jgi:hypothetical protein
LTAANGLEAIRAAFATFVMSHNGLQW